MGNSILIVDDSISMRQSVRFVLEQEGFSVTEAGDGIEGLAKQDGTKFDLMLTDVNMPNMDGLSMIRSIRSGGMNKFTPILVLTTESQGAVVEEGKKCGATGWIVKPFTPEKLVSTMRKVLA